MNNNERLGEEVSLAETISDYSDEPDWGMDIELFSEDQYPELWKEEYAMMGGGNQGTPSQAFRHMYWPEYNFRHPLQSFKMPLEKINEPMGEAPQRSQIFYDLAQRAKSLGHPYWAARFVANALHYVEDVTNPFHSSQTPTKKYLMMVFNPRYGSGLQDFVLQVTNIVIYYHFSFERFLGHLMANQFERLGQALLSGEAPGIAFHPGRVEELTTNMAKYSNQSSASAGRAAKDFFPPITVKYTDFVADDFMNEAWWAEVLKKGEQESSARKKYFDVAEEMFRSLGWAIRSVVKDESGN